MVVVVVGGGGGGGGYIVTEVMDEGNGVDRKK